MIISHRYRFIFIKTIKTAGTSIEVHLSQHCGDADVVTPVYPTEAGHHPRHHRGPFNPVREWLSPYVGKPGFPSHAGILRQWVSGRRFFNHMPAVSVQARVPADLWASYFKFCVERNPVDKVLSFYRMQHQRGEVQNLEEFFGKGVFPKDWTRYHDVDDRLLVDRVLRFEQLDEELGEVLGALGVPYEGRLTPRAKGSRTADPTGTGPKIHARQLRIIEACFAKEMQAFGYR